MYYIEETDKLKKMLKLFKVIKTDDDKIILPVQSENLNLKYQQKLAQKTCKILKQTNSNKVVISKKIQNYEYYINYLNSANIEIVSGKWLLKMMVSDILNFILEKKQLKKQELELSVLINEVSDIDIEQIKQFANEYKIINIVTNHIEKFKKIEEQIYNEIGVVITISNNKKKSLAKSQIIVNFDFPKELINKYNIYEQAIIVNTEGNIKIDKKRFNGLVINDIEINNLNNEKYVSKQLYEANFFKKQNYKYIRKKIQEDEIKVTELIGNNGAIIL